MPLQSADNISDFESTKKKKCPENVGLVNYLGRWLFHAMLLYILSRTCTDARFYHLHVCYQLENTYYKFKLGSINLITFT